MNYALSMLVAVMLDLAVGWPAQLFKRIGHPVTWIGRLIAGCEARLNSGSKPRRLVLGVMATGIVIIVVLCVAWGLQRIPAYIPRGGCSGRVSGLALQCGAFYEQPYIADH